MINKYCVVIGGMVFRVSLFQQSIGELLVAYNPATKLYLLHFEIYKGGLQRTRIVALSKHDTQYGNRKGAPPPLRPISGTQYHIVVPYLLKSRLNN
jgi:hypothetical protein